VIEAFASLIPSSTTAPTNSLLAALTTFLSYRFTAVDNSAS
jgi:hypothetical protein